jgi:hypothetical protein
MSAPRRVRCYQYVNRPYDDVRDLFRRDALHVYRRATKAATARANGLVASLHAGVSGVEIAIDVRLHDQDIKDEAGIAGLVPVTRMTFSWEAGHAAALFPTMEAELSFWPLTSSETQLEIEGAYRPPLGVVGTAIDAAVGHRLAEATVHRFLDDVAEQLRRELAASE